MTLEARSRCPTCIAPAAVSLSTAGPESRRPAAVRAVARGSRLRSARYSSRSAPAESWQLAPLRRSGRRRRAIFSHGMRSRPDAQALLAPLTGHDVKLTCRHHAGAWCSSRRTGPGAYCESAPRPPPSGRRLATTCNSADRPNERGPRCSLVGRHSVPQLAERIACGTDCGPQRDVRQGVGPVARWAGRVIPPQGPQLSRDVQDPSGWACVPLSARRPAADPRLGSFGATRPETSHSGRSASRAFSSPARVPQGREEVGSSGGRQLSSLASACPYEAPFGWPTRTRA
jgi:hypothetical protein